MSKNEGGRDPKWQKKRYDLLRENFWCQNHDKVLVNVKNRVFLGSGIREKSQKIGGGWVPVIFNKLGGGGSPKWQKSGGGCPKSKFLRSAIKVLGFFDILINDFDSFCKSFKEKFKKIQKKFKKVNKKFKKVNKKFKKS